MNQDQPAVLTNDPDATLASPRFDAEATITAKPVVPLARRAANHANAAMGRVVSLSNRRRSLLVGLFVTSALFVGVAGGFALAIYRNRQVAEPSSANLTSPPEPTAPQADVKESPAAITAAAAKNEATTGETKSAAPVVPSRPRDTTADSTDASRESSAAARRKKTDDENANSKPRDAGRNSRAANASAEEERPKGRDERERRREERAEEKRSRQEERQSRREARAINRVGDVLANRPARRRAERNAPEPRRVDRIRDIFEGRQP